MKNIKIGNMVYHYLQMNKIGTVVKINKSTGKTMWMTEGSPSFVLTATVQYPDGSLVDHDLADLFRADRE